MNMLWLLLTLNLSNPYPRWPFNTVQPGFATVEACEAAGNALIDQGQAVHYACQALPANRA